MANRKNDAGAIPSWPDDGSPPGVSPSLWDEIAEIVQDAHRRSTDSGTPISSVAESSPVFCSHRSQDGNIVGRAVEPPDAVGSPRPKRRRMLEYPEAASDYSTNSQHPEYQVESSQESSFTEASQRYGYYSRMSSSPYWYPKAGSTASDADTEEHGWLGLPALHSQFEQKAKGGLLHQGQAWVHEHPPLRKGLPKFAEDENADHEFLDTKVWTEQCFQQSQADHGVERLAHIPQDRYNNEKNPMRCIFASPGLKMLAGREETGAQGIHTPFRSRPSTPGSQLSTQRKPKPKPVTPVPFCPFDIVKPIPGVGDNVTLDDINERISTPKERAGEPAIPTFAEDGSQANPSDTGIGLSGKSVVSLRTIHTQGSGILTIIRTKD